MTTALHPSTPVYAVDRPRVRSVARVTGVAYLGLAVCGFGGEMIRNRLDAPGAVGTEAKLVDHEQLARLGIAADLGAVLTQAVVAVCFFLLFRRINAAAAGSTMAFGLVNSVMMLVGTAFSATALEVALSGGAGSASQALLLSDLQDAAWLTGGLFFGLWLMPMGWLVLRSGFMPRLLGWTLLVGGVGYLLSTYAAYLLPDISRLPDVLLLPSAVGELWMVGYLLIEGVSRTAEVEPDHVVT